jgi:hypothetical protein
MKLAGRENKLLGFTSGFELKRKRGKRIRE